MSELSQSVWLSSKQEPGLARPARISHTAGHFACLAGRRRPRRHRVPAADALLRVKTTSRFGPRSPHRELQASLPGSIRRPLGNRKTDARISKVRHGSSLKDPHRTPSNGHGSIDAEGVTDVLAPLSTGSKRGPGERESGVPENLAEGSWSTMDRAATARLAVSGYTNRTVSSCSSRGRRGR